MTERQANFPALVKRLRPQCEQIIAQYEEKRSALLPIAHVFQEHEGFVSPEAMRAIAAMLDVTLAEVEGAISFYTLFFRKPVGKYMLQVCRGIACTINGAEDIMAYFREKLGIGHQQTTEDGLFSYEEVECLAACDKPTCMQVNLEFIYSLTPKMIDDMLAALRAGTHNVKPRAQTEKPDHTWTFKQDAQVSTGHKSAGARDVVAPNNAGGLGDRSGVIMLDRIVNSEIELRERSRESIVKNANALKEIFAKPLRSDSRLRNVGPTNGAMDGGSEEAAERERSPEGGTNSSSATDYRSAEARP